MADDFDEEHDEDCLSDTIPTHGIGNLKWLLVQLTRRLTREELFTGAVGMMDAILSDEDLYDTQVLDIFVQVAATGEYVLPYPIEGEEPEIDDQVAKFAEYLDSFKNPKEEKND